MEGSSDCVVAPPGSLLKDVGKLDVWKVGLKVAGCMGTLGNNPVWWGYWWDSVALLCLCCGGGGEMCH